MLPSGERNPFLRETVGGMLATMAAPGPDREAVVAPDRRVTYAELDVEEFPMLRRVVVSSPRPCSNGSR